MASFIEILLLLTIIYLLIRRGEGFGKMVFGAKPRKLVLDSCALIDGRIVELVDSGFMADELVIPQFILSELQLLADGNDSHKRERARFGLDIAHQLQDAAKTTVTIDPSIFPEVHTTDDKLIALAQKLNAQLYTTDYNLGKVAAIKAVHVLNINELAQRLRPVALPGETLKIKLIQRGSSRDQGVGYLEDGTMIVVDGGARYVGKTMPVTVSRMHQTVAGKMVFGQIAHSKQAENSDDAKHSDQDAQEKPAREPSPRPAAIATPQAKIRARLATNTTDKRRRHRRAPGANSVQ